MAWSVLDLSSITDDLIALLKHSVDPASPVWAANGGPIDFFHVEVSGAMPETDRNGSGCLLSFYLLHVSQDPYYRNTPVNGPVPQLNRRQPLSLNLYYLLTSYANKNYNQEQQAMSIAMRCFHENAIVLKPPPPPSEEYTITMEVETADEMSRLWQALSTPLRLSVVYKVSIVFVTPSEQPTVPAPPPTGVGLAVAPKGIASSLPAQLFGAAVRESFLVPPEAGADHADAITPVVAPGLVRPRDDLIVAGLGLDSQNYANVYLSVPGGAETDITTWRQATGSATELRVRFPATVGVPPAASPPPGNYLLSVGGNGPPPVRTNAVPVAVAALIDNVARPPKLEPDSGGFYTVAGAGFTAGLTAVFLGDAALTNVVGTPVPDEFQINPAETSLVFKPPALPAGRYDLRVRVNQIDSPPSWYVEL